MKLLKIFTLMQIGNIFHISIVSVLILIFINPVWGYERNETIKIVYSTRPFIICKKTEPFKEIIDSKGKSWLYRIKNEMHATGVRLMIDWSLFPNPKNQNITSTKQLIKCLQLIRDYGLDIYIHIKFGNIPGFLVKKLPQDCFQKDYMGKVVKLPQNTPLLNFVHPISKKYIYTYFKKVLNLIQGSVPVEEIIPTFNWEAETEYPHQIFTGYSEAMISSFQNYLKIKYKESIKGLNIVWFKNDKGKYYKKFTEIIPSSSWGNSKNYYLPPNKYDNPYGRLEWLQFRTFVLKKMIDSLAFLAHQAGLRMPIQIGSTFDARIERRGWLDITPLLENVDGIRVADIAGRYSSFEFHANYISSILNYWKWIWNQRKNKDKDYFFSTETNWPGFRNSPPDLLVHLWSSQVKAFYREGADAIFIYGWFKKNDPDFLLKNIPAYRAWFDTLALYKTKKRKTTPQKNTSIFLSSAFMSVTHGYENKTKSEIEWAKSIFPFQRDCFILTDYMINRTPAFLNTFNSIILNKNSAYIFEHTLIHLLSPKITTPFIDLQYNFKRQKYIHFSGLYNELGQKRQDFLPNLIWRTRPDLQLLFPNGNKRDPKVKQFKFEKSIKDFIEWVVFIGNKKYEGLSIDFNNFNSAAYKIWKKNIKLQQEFPDGYYSRDNPQRTLLDALIEKAQSMDPEEARVFKQWPFIIEN